MKTPQAKPNLTVLQDCKTLGNRGFQAVWLKNPDGTQGPKWQLSTCGSGCKISEGCQLCLWEVERQLMKMRGEKVPRVKPQPENLYQPLRWKNPKNVFACPEGDLFHKGIPDDFILEAFDVMKQCSHHNFVVTTKRAKRLSMLKRGLPNVFVGVSVESQEYMHRTDALLELPRGFRRILFVAPMLTPVVIPRRVLRKVDWIICSPERGGKGRKARPCEEEWQADLIDQAERHDIPVFLDVPFQEERVFRLGGKYMEAPAQLCL